MQRLPPKRVSTPSSATRASYYAEGRRALELAQAHHPDLCALDALVRAQETIPATPARILRPSTTRRYLEDHRTIVAVLARACRRKGIACDAQGAMARIEAALKRRRGRPALPRTASLKVKDAGYVEAERVFRQLKATALRHRSQTAAATAFYIIVVTRLGMRPIELCGAVVEGHLLYLPNAKRAAGQDPWRVLDLGAYPDAFIAATHLLTILAPQRADTHAFVRWRNALAASLARACAAVPTRRLSLYSFRHVALATWEAAGYTTAEIAELAGHLSLDTAAVHYARARAGWANATLPRAVVATHREISHPTIEIGNSWSDVPNGVGQEDVPMPKPSPKPVQAATAGLSPIASWFDDLLARKSQLPRALQADQNSESESDYGSGDDPARLHR